MSAPVWVSEPRDGEQFRRLVEAPRVETLRRVIADLPDRLIYPEFCAGHGRQGVDLDVLLRRCAQRSRGREDWQSDAGRALALASLPEARMEAGTMVHESLLTWRFRGC